MATKIELPHRTTQNKPRGLLPTSETLDNVLRSKLPIPDEQSGVEPLKRDEKRSLKSMRFLTGLINSSIDRDGLYHNNVCIIKDRNAIIEITRAGPGMSVSFHISREVYDEHNTYDRVVIILHNVGEIAVQLGETSDDLGIAKKGIFTTPQIKVKGGKPVQECTIELTGLEYALAETFTIFFDKNVTRPVQVKPFDESNLGQLIPEIKKAMGEGL